MIKCKVMGRYISTYQSAAALLKLICADFAMYQSQARYLQINWDTEFHGNPSKHFLKLSFENQSVTHSQTDRHHPLP